MIKKGGAVTPEKKSVSEENRERKENKKPRLLCVNHYLLVKLGNHRACCGCGGRLKLFKKRAYATPRRTLFLAICELCGAEMELAYREIPQNLKATEIARAVSE